MVTPESRTNLTRDVPFQLYFERRLNDSLTLTDPLRPTYSYMYRFREGTEQISDAVFSISRASRLVVCADVVPMARVGAPCPIRVPHGTFTTVGVPCAP